MLRIYMQLGEEGMPGHKIGILTITKRIRTDFFVLTVLVYFSTSVCKNLWCLLYSPSVSFADSSPYTGEPPSGAVPWFHSTSHSGIRLGGRPRLRVQKILFLIILYLISCFPADAVFFFVKKADSHKINQFSHLEFVDIAAIIKDVSGGKPP